MIEIICITLYIVLYFVCFIVLNVLSCKDRECNADTYYDEEFDELLFHAVISLLAPAILTLLVIETITKKTMNKILSKLDKREE